MAQHSPGDIESGGRDVLTDGSLVSVDAAFALLSDVADSLPSSMRHPLHSTKSLVRNSMSTLAQPTSTSTFHLFANYQHSWYR
jgi:hypothetical protein